MCMCQTIYKATATATMNSYACDVLTIPMSIFLFTSYDQKTKMQFAKRNKSENGF